MSALSKRGFIFLLFIFCGLHAVAQLITVSGKVIDAKSGLPLSGATIVSGKIGTSTNKNGEFVLLGDQAIITSQGLTARFIGYRDAHLPYKGQSYQFALTTDTKQLQTVTISSNTETIVQKAYRLIPINYIRNAFHLLGLVNMVHSARDTSGYQYFYRNRASVKLYYPPYTNQKVPEIALLSKKDSVAFNRNSAFSVRYVGGYTAIAKFDLVHVRAAFLKGETKKFIYQLNGKEWLDGNRVFVINFSNTQNKLSGTLYIDTASYAFVKIAYTMYNINGGIFITTDKRMVTVQYKRAAAGWVFDNLHLNSQARHEGFDIDRITEFKAVDNDTTNAVSFPYQQVIPQMHEDKQIVVTQGLKISLADSLKFRTEIQSSDTVFTFVKVPMISTVNQEAKLSKRLLAAYRSFLVGDNLRGSLGIGISTLDVSGYQPLLGKSLGSIAKYHISRDIQLRLFAHKELFFQFINDFNLGIGGINFNESGYGLTYNFVFNKTHHPLSISPFVSYSIITLKHKDNELYRQKSWVYGISLSYELSPRMNAFVNGRYYEVGTVTNQGLLVQNNPITLGAGLIFKVKF